MLYDEGVISFLLWSAYPSSNFLVLYCTYTLHFYQYLKPIIPYLDYINIHARWVICSLFKLRLLILRHYQTYYYQSCRIPQTQKQSIWTRQRHIWNLNPAAYSLQSLVTSPHSLRLPNEDSLVVHLLVLPLRIATPSSVVEERITIEDKVMELLHGGKAKTAERKTRRSSSILTSSILCVKACCACLNAGKANY